MLATKYKPDTISEKFVYFHSYLARLIKLCSMIFMGEMLAKNPEATFEEYTAQFTALTEQERGVCQCLSSCAPLIPFPTSDSRD